MILSLALSLAFVAQSDPVQFKHGAWSGRCFREGYLDGRDHELCQAGIFVESGAQLERSAGEILVHPWPGADCEGEDGRLPSTALVGRNRVAVVTAFVRSQIAATLDACRVKRPVPAIRMADVAAFLRASDDLKSGTFLLLDPAKRAPAAAKCGRQLEQAWRGEVRTHAIPEGSSVNLMMYTFSKSGPDRAEKRFAALPAMMEDYFGMYTGPGGVVMTARKSAEAWRNPPADWFVKLCDVGIEAWSGFIELALYPQKDNQPPIFGVRVATGVASNGNGFLITQQSLTGQPQ